MADGDFFEEESVARFCLDGEGFAEVGLRVVECHAVCIEDFTVGSFRVLSAGDGDFAAVNVQASVHDDAAVLENRVAFHHAAAGVEVIPVNFVADAIEARCEVGGDGEGGRRQGVGFSGVLSLAVLSVVVGICHDVALVRGRSVFVDVHVEASVLVAVEIDIGVHPGGEGTGETRCHHFACHGLELVSQFGEIESAAACLVGGHLLHHAFGIGEFDGRGGAGVVCDG